MIVPSPRDAVPSVAIGLEKLLIVEGDTPKNFFEAFLRHLGIAHVIEIRSYDSVTNLRRFLKAISSTADFRTKVKSLGIARDAEDDPVAVLSSVNDAIQAASLPKHMTVEVAILPHDSIGMLETLCVQSVSENPEFKCVNEFFRCLKGNGISLPEGPKMAKRYAQVYLATQQDVQLTPGVAAYRNAWPFSEASFNEIRNFLRRI